MSLDQDEKRAHALASRVTILILTALPKEYAAVHEMLDGPVEHHTDSRSGGDAFVLGEIPARGGGTHCVALMLGDQGNMSAAVRVAVAVPHFASVEVALMVGIAGGVPNPGNAESHVRLGDIVASGPQGVVKYDFVKEVGDQLQPRHSPRSPDARLLKSAQRLQVRVLRGDLAWEAHLPRARGLPHSGRPAAETDRLASSADPGAWVEHPSDEARLPGRSRAFLGTIAATDRLLKNARHRDEIRDRFGVRAVEMEGAGVAEAAWDSGIQYFIVRGICDYCDLAKGDGWQGYAAAVAAAYARALLEETGPFAIRAVQTQAATGDSASMPAHAAGSSNVPFSLILDSRPILEGEHHAQLDDLRSLIFERRQPELALERLRSLQARIWHTAVPQVRARIRTLTGWTHVQLGNVEEGAKLLVEALSDAPLEARTQANGAYGHLLLGNVAAAREWAEKARAIDPTNATAIQILVLLDSRADDQVLAEAQRVVGKRAEVLLALGHRALRVGDSVAACRWLLRGRLVDGDTARVVDGHQMSATITAPAMAIETERDRAPVRWSSQRSALGQLT